MATIPADGKVVEGAPVFLATTATVVANPAPMPTEVPLAHVEGGIAQSAVDADGVAIVRSVKLEGRAFTDKKFAYFYGGCIGLFVILSIVLFAGQHDEYTFKGSDVTGVGECENSDRQTRAARPIIIPWAARAAPVALLPCDGVLTRVLLPSQITRRMP